MPERPPFPLTALHCTARFARPGAHLTSITPPHTPNGRSDDPVRYRQRRPGRRATVTTVGIDRLQLQMAAGASSTEDGTGGWRHHRPAMTSRCCGQGIGIGIGIGIEEQARVPMGGQETRRPPVGGLRSVRQSAAGAAQNSLTLLWPRALNSAGVRVSMLL